MYIATDELQVYRDYLPSGNTDLAPIITPEEIQQYVIHNESGRWQSPRAIPLDYSKKLPVLTEQSTCK